MKKLFLAVSISFLSLNSATASYLEEKDIITDQLDIVSADERAKAGKLKSPGNWEVKQTAYNKNTGLIEIVAQNKDKYSHIAVNPVSVSWGSRMASFFRSALSKGAGIIGWLPSLITEIGADSYNLYYDPDGYFKLTPKPEHKDGVVYYVPDYDNFPIKFYYSTSSAAADQACVIFSGKGPRIYESTYHFHERDGLYYSNCRATDPENNGLVSASVRFFSESIRPDISYTPKQVFGTKLPKILKSSKASRDFYRRAAEYDIVNGVYDEELQKRAVTSSKFKPGTAPLVFSESKPAPEPLPSPNPDVLPKPSTSPSPSTVPSPGTAPNPLADPVTAPNPNPSTRPDPKVMPVPEPGISPNPIITPSPSTSPSPSTVPSPGVSPSPTTNPGISPSPSPGTAPAPQTAPNPNRDNDNAKVFNMPEFCDWAFVVCNVIDWVSKWREVDSEGKTIPNPEENERWDYDTITIDNKKDADSFDLDYVRYGGACPAPVKFNMPVGAVAVPLEFSLQPLCDFAKTVRPAILALAYLSAMGIVASAIKG
ncbi:virulence factor TspB C-terminal domain-related protein [Moraxella marmotae]|uniref:virulence factor TspB C-terminal domain-related protein n=1 Tax=Moraxella marmotae TaxID=3344520 RepID=UPI0035F4EFD3